MCFRTDDPIADFNRLDAEQWELLQKCPKCSVCDEHIQEEEAYYIHDVWICEACMENFKKEVPIEDGC